MVEIESIIDEVYDGKPNLREWDKVSGVAWHRVGVDKKTGVTIGENGIDIAKAFIGERPEFLEVASATGHQNPYSFYLLGNGRIQQALPLSEIGHHARRFSKPYIGVGAIGDFRVDPPTAEQWESGIELASLLCVAYGQPEGWNRGHGEIPGAHGGEKAPGKPYACPGEKWDMNAFRDVVRQMTRDKALRELYDAGMVFK